MSRQSGDSPSRPRALVLAPEAPYPVLGGGPLRTASLIEYLRRRYEVHAIVFREPGTPDPVPGFPDDVHVETIQLPFHSKTAFARAARNAGRALRGVPPLVDRFAGFDTEVERLAAGRFDLGVIEHFWCAPYARVMRDFCERLVLDLHNVESVLLERTAASEKEPAASLFRRFARCCRDLERRWLPEFSTVLVTSEADAAHIDGPAIVYPNAIPFVAQPHRVKRDDIAFSGNLAYQPNQSAMRWFHANVWPELRRTCPGLRWRLIGRNEHAVPGPIRADDQVDITGPVEDAVAELASARAAIAPVLAGSGTRIKIIEAWAAGLPVVSTTVGAEGLPCRDGEHILIADQAPAFAATLQKLLHSADVQVQLGRAGRRLYEERLTWEAAWACLSRAGW